MGVMIINVDSVGQVENKAANKDECQQKVLGVDDTYLPQNAFIYAMWLVKSVN
jgi:hypothetical protein